jgi:predicted Zn-dependent peptidase
MREPEIHTLKNGIRVAHCRVSASKIVHCGIMLDIGSRDESETIQGIAHFWEHMAFKGTPTRNAFHILNRLESVGGELNAFTDKEKIMFYASVRTEHFMRAADLLTDIAFHASFPENHIRRERKVILEEMSMYYDDPDGALQDEFDALIYNRHAMGMNILGTEKSISRFHHKHFVSFVKKNLDTRRVIFSVVGDLTSDQVMQMAEELLAPISAKRAVRNRERAKGYRSRHVTIQRPVKQARCAIGGPAYSIKDDRRMLLYFLNNILGGPGMNSRLNMSLREKHGYVYSVGSQYIPFSDTGLFVVSFGTDPSQMKKAMSLVHAEMDKLSSQPMGRRQLSVSREQFLGQLAMAEENHIGFMMMMARNILDTGAVTSFELLHERIRTVSAEQLQAIAAEVFDPRRLSSLILEPENLPS